MHGNVNYFKCIEFYIYIYNLLYITDAMPHPPTTLPFTATPGLNISLPRNANPLQYLELFMTMSLWRYLIDTTNNYARAHLGSMPPTRRSLFRNWRDISLLEMKAFVGMIINMGLTSFPTSRTTGPHT